MSADLVVIAAGVTLSAFLWWFFFGPKRAGSARIASGVQDVKVVVKGGYSPSVIRVRQGVPLRLTFDRQESGDCTSRVVFADLGVSKTIPAFGSATLEFTPDRVGEFDFACGMNMIHGTLVVEPALGASQPPDEHEHEQAARDVAVAVGVGPSTTATVATEHAEFGVIGMSCASCVTAIESALGALTGVDRADVNVGTQRATVDYDPTQVSENELQAAVAASGYRLTPAK